ncbi:MAG: hypothetical protein IH623_10880 [Verrucomicrobia bacterium]|nr:hypothetical protein [Verrucomicrobiota bacterium]
MKAAFRIFKSFEAIPQDKSGQFPKHDKGAEEQTGQYDGISAPSQGQPASDAAIPPVQLFRRWGINE